MTFHRKSFLALMASTAFIGCVFGVDEFPCWLDRMDEIGDCQQDYITCIELDGFEAMDACMAELEDCRDEADDATLDCTGDKGCVKPYVRCTSNCRDDCDGSDDEDCYSDCWDDCADDLEDCAAWWDRACEEDCDQDLDDCFQIADDNYSTDAQLFDDVHDCLDTLYDECLPECYE